MTATVRDQVLDLRRRAPPSLQALVPEAARGLGLVVATPRLTVEQSWSRPFDELRVGDVLTRTVRQEVEGSVPMVLPAPEFVAAEGIGVYPERPTFESQTDRGEFSGSRTDAVTYVMETEGLFELPEVVLAWWDLDADQLRRKVLPAAELVVAGNPDLAALYAWRDSMEWLPGPPTLESLTQLAGDPDLGLELRSLQSAATGAVGSDDADWNASEIARRLSAGRDRWNRPRSSLAGPALGPLNPRPAGSLSSPVTLPFLKLLSALLVTAALAASARAVEDAPEAPGSPLITDRPTDSASPDLVPRRTLQIEIGVKLTHLDEGSSRTDTRELPDLLARYGFSDRFEGRLTATGWTFRSGTAGDQDGFNDISLGTKIALGQERGRRPQTALLADVSFPVGQTGFTDDYMIPKVLFLAGHTLTDRLGLTWNLGPSFVTSKGNEGDARTDVTLNYAVALGAAMRGSAALFGEVYGNFDFASGSSDSHTVQVGTTVLLKATLQLDFRVGHGLVDSEPDWLAGMGLAFRLPR